MCQFSSLAFHISWTETPLETQCGLSPSLIVCQKAMGDCPASSCEGVGPILMHQLFHFSSSLFLCKGKLLGLELPLKQLVLWELLLSTGSASQHRSCISQALSVQLVGFGHPQDSA